MTIINLTQHAPMEQQRQLGVFDAETEEVRRLLTFAELPSKAEVTARAEALAALAHKAGATAAMIGGAPYLMGALETALKARGINPLYAFSERVSRETVLPDGSVTKTSVFVFKGFVEV